MYISAQKEMRGGEKIMEDKQKLMETVAEKFSKLAVEDKFYVMGVMQGILLMKEKKRKK